jgi:hypothetical protein
MSTKRVPANQPLVSVILTTRDRPRLLALALECYREQTYPARELLVLDDGVETPADVEAVKALGGRLIRVDPETPIGSKINLGAAQAQGVLCQKLDDDDWYSPRFLEEMVWTLMAGSLNLTYSTIAFPCPFLFFDVERWEVRHSYDNEMSGHVLFPREVWERAPFRPISMLEKEAFAQDQVAIGTALRAVPARHLLLAVRHHAAGGERGHTWTHQPDGEVVEERLREHPLHDVGPETLLPDRALGVYRELRLGNAAAVGPSSSGWCPWPHSPESCRCSGTAGNTLSRSSSQGDPLLQAEESSRIAALRPADAPGPVVGFQDPAG